jgi:hypothetical protein
MSDETTVSQASPLDFESTEAVLEQGDMRSSNGLFIGWILLLAVFALLFAFNTWTAIQNIITVPPLISRNYDFYRENKLDGLIKPVPWVQLIIALVTPALGFIVALLAGRRRSLWRRALVLLVALCAVSAITASVSAYISTTYGL